MTRTGGRRSSSGSSTTSPSGAGCRTGYDFGTGYSNLAYLRRLPVHTLKLAGSFVTGKPGPGSDTVDVEVTELLINLPHVLDMTVVAESVESAEQLHQLRALGCDTGRGYYFSPAVPPAAIPELLARQLEDVTALP